MQIGNIIQLLSGGLAMGAIYVLVALGLYITHLTTHRVNFGQGDFLMVGTFLMLFIRKAGLPLLVAIAMTLIVLAIMGWLLERIAIRPLDRKKSTPVGAFSWILTTAGIALILQNVIELGFGKTSQYSSPLFSSRRDQVVQVLGAGLFVEEILVIIAAVVIVIIFYAFMFHSRWGKNIQAVAFNPESAKLLGVHTDRVKTGVFIIAAILAAVAGVLIGPLVTINPHMGLVLTIKALIVAAIGGFANPVGILVGGILFGVFESLSNYIDSGFGDLYPLLAALIIIAVKPSGLFSERHADVR
ncbi:branched-chain amino acid transport system permease protein [Jezberella montanilacus]|jgi:branched-chain amino acid transport system permease protein|uniref:Branched-chain amino acid transport system permease protein n=1 Tax=Jezberella montanilacus TaxID=323426 RepID=A0A2T0XD66_9BURK|nr:branched-chain amino acid ABC transporter permease [Jezberella montanilacus]PRY96878.1 branched-chain amino acid transport system permease protein [Jezberella montanilacus]